MSLVRTIFIALFFVLLAGCSGQDIRQGVYVGIYEGMRTEHMSHNTPCERASRPDVGYEQYSNERKEIIENDTHREATDVQSNHGRSAHGGNTASDRY